MMEGYEDIMREQYARWEAKFRSALAENPGDVKARRGLAGVLVWKGQLREAEAMMMGIASSGQTDHEFWGALAALKYYLGQYRESYECFRKAIAEEPTRFEGREASDHLNQLEMFESLVKAFEETGLEDRAPWLNGQAAYEAAQRARAAPYRSLHGDK